MGDRPLTIDRIITRKAGHVPGLPLCEVPPVVRVSDRVSRSDGGGCRRQGTGEGLILWPASVVKRAFFHDDACESDHAVNGRLVVVGRPRLPVVMWRCRPMS